MRRSWFGLGLLVLLLALALGAAWVMDAIHAPVVRDLEGAALCARQQSWASAEVLAEAAEEKWRKWDGFRRCLADHSPVEEIEGSFAQLRAYVGEESGEFGALCQELARQVEAIGEAHGLSLWNLL